MVYYQEECDHQARSKRNLILNQEAVSIISPNGSPHDNVENPCKKVIIKQEQKEILLKTIA